MKNERKKKGRNYLFIISYQRVINGHRLSIVQLRQSS